MKLIHEAFVIVVGVKYRIKNAEKAYDLFCDDTNVQYDEGLTKTNNVRLEREPSNPHDHLAIKVFLYDIFVGYIPKKGAKEIRKLIKKDDVIMTVQASANWTVDDEPAFYLFIKFFEKENGN